MSDEFLSGIQKFQRNLERVASQQSVTFGELFSDDFMLRHTDFASIGAFFDASPFNLETNEDLAALPEADLDSYVVTNTRFSSWEEMKSVAGSEWMARRLREG